ncbi:MULTISPECIES: hypothetical protein [unclassified Duganella]|uniref:hypothetical protein n=1 Tax=unclassified Duganella TaxID=2636909 RepID=UPI000E34C776|nr:MULTISPECIES: hypothetical protein [unclassified Duganella]RFP18565.1 hypothetical protein D0T23_01805 [Duganella sp. BJB475]RFP35230.1 hypothetical protein D0T21_01805 [Duganella sp. BJB476]
MEQKNRFISGGVVMLRRGPPRLQPCHNGAVLGCFREAGRHGNHLSLRAYPTMTNARIAQARAPETERTMLLQAPDSMHALPLLEPSVAPHAPPGKRGVVLVHLFHGARFGQVDELVGRYRGAGVVEAGLLQAVDAACVAWIGIVQDMQALAALHPALCATEAALNTQAELLLLEPCAASRLRWIGVKQ